MKYVNLLIVTVVLFFAVIWSASGKADVIVLSDHNTIVLRLPIVPDTASAVQHQLIAKSAALLPNEPLYLFLDSPGGMVEEGERIIETAKGLGRPVHTISRFSASMAFIIAQYLDTRYILESGTLMSHPMYGGFEGSIPGTFISRFNATLVRITEVDSVIANRAKLDRSTYEQMIQNELWLSAQDSVNQKFADKIVQVQCDATLSGPAAPSVIRVMGFEFKIIFDKCPLISTPHSAMANKAEGKQLLEHILGKKASLVNKSWY